MTAEDAARAGACCGNSPVNPASILDYERAKLRAAVLVGDTDLEDATELTLLGYLEDVGGDETAAFILLEYYQQRNNDIGVLGLVGIAISRYVEATAAGLSQTAARWLSTVLMIQRAQPILYSIG